MRRISTIWAIAALLLLAVPAIADDAVVGVVYRSYTLEDCRKSFENSEVGMDLNVDPNLRQFKGPLLDQNGAESGCYCSGDYVMDQAKKRCVLCQALTGVDTVYYLSENAEFGAAAEYNGKEIGCRCAKKSGNKVFSAVVGGKCTYKEPGEDLTACQAKFQVGGKYDGVKVCDRTEPDERKLGTTKGVECCCDPTYIKKINPSTGTPYCEKMAATVEDSACKKEWASMAGPNVGKCADPTIATDPKKSDQKQMLWVGQASTDGTIIECCCASGYVRDSTGRCIKDVDECGEIVPGSVKKGRGDAGGIKVGDDYGYKKWEKKATEDIAKKKLECYCKTGHIPADQKPNTKKSSGEEETEYVLDTCAAASTCAQIVLGSVKSDDENADPGQKVVPGSWETTIVEALKTLKLECSCPKESVGYNSNSIAGNDVCAISNLRCVNSDELASFMKVGVCQARMTREDFPLPFETPVGIVGGSGVTLQDKKKNIGRIVTSIGYGLERALGIRDIRMAISEAFRECVAPKKDDPFYLAVDYAECLANYPCDYMPNLKLAYQELGTVKLAGGVYWGTKTTAKALEEFESAIAKLASEAGGEIKKLRDMSESALANIKLTVSNTDPVAISGFKTQLSNSLMTIRSERGVVVRSATAKLKALEKSLGEGGVEMTWAQYTAAGAPEIGTGLTPGAKLIDEFTGGIKTMDSGLDNTLRLGDNIISTPFNDLMDIRAVSGHLTQTNAISTTLAGGTTQLTGALDNVDDVTKLAKKPGVPGFRYVTAKIKGFFGKIDDFMSKGPIRKKIASGAKKLGKAIGKIAYWYGFVDLVGSSLSTMASTDLQILPGQEANKVSVGTPFTIKPSQKSSGGYDKLYAVSNVDFSFKKDVMGTGLPRELDGGFFDLSLTAKLTRPPEGIEGLTYKCTGTSCTCGSDNILKGCTCYPISNSIEVELKSTGKKGVSFANI
jgi:hypothetical protein